MKVYRVETAWTQSQIHCVVANTICQAKQLFKAKYPYTKIKSITLFSEYVVVPKEIEQ
jgi:hypothetical protein